MPSATRAPTAGAQDKLSSKGKGRTRVLDSFFFLSSAKPQRCEDRNKERNESWIPDPFKSSLITRDPNAKHFQDEKCCQIMFTIQICQTRKTSWIQVISVHSYSLNSELPRASFQYTRLLVYTWPSAVVSPASTEEEPLGHVSPMPADWKALCISVPNAMRFPGRLALMNHFSVCILFIQHWQLSFALPPDSKLFKDWQV